VLFVGRLSAWKGVDDFIEVATSTDRDDVRFEIIGGPVPGDHTAVRRIERRCDRLGERRLRYLGVRDDTAAAMAGADMLVVPSRRPDPYPTVVLEGMRAGCVVVATGGGGAAEAIRDGHDGFIVPMADPDTLVEVIGGLLDDPRQMAVVGGRAAAAFRQRHSAESFAHRLDIAFEAAGL
jgi:glycosyltransferase involved in cell wall biosynthesis